MKLSSSLIVFAVFFISSCAIPKHWTKAEISNAAKIKLHSVHTSTPQYDEPIGSVQETMGPEKELIGQILFIPTLGLINLAYPATAPNETEVSRRLKLQAYEMGGTAIVNYIYSYDAWTASAVASGDVIK
jgi:hypothetical protein